MALTHAERLTYIRTALGFGGNTYQDDVLEFYIDEAINFLIDSGVTKEIAESKAAIGAIATFVNDTYNYSSGDVEYSDALIKRVIQLSTRGEASV